MSTPTNCTFSLCLITLLPQILSLFFSDLREISQIIFYLNKYIGIKRSQSLHIRYDLTFITLLVPLAIKDECSFFLHISLIPKSTPAAMIVGLSLT